MCHRSESIPSNAISMCFGLQRFCSLSRRLVGFHHTTIIVLNSFSLAIFLIYICFHDARMMFVSLAGHGWSRRSFQFSSCFFFFLIISEYSLSSRSIKENPSQLSSIVKLRFLFCPFLLFSMLSGFTNFRPNFWPYTIWSGSRLNFCQSAPGPHVSFWEVLFQ